MEDLAEAREGDDQVKERTGCLISEVRCESLRASLRVLIPFQVVVPGWVAEDHAFLDYDKVNRGKASNARLTFNLAESCSFSYHVSASVARDLWWRRGEGGRTGRAG